MLCVCVCVSVCARMCVCCFHQVTVRDNAKQQGILQFESLVLFLSTWRIQAFNKTKGSHSEPTNQCPAEEEQLMAWFSSDDRERGEQREVLRSRLPDPLGM